MPSVRSRYRYNGFSLIELLVAVLVIVLLTSVVSLNVGSGGGDIEREHEVRRLAATLGYAQSEAELSGADYGLYLERPDRMQDGFSGTWLRRYDQGWAEPQRASEVLQPFQFEPGAELMLSLIGMPDVEITRRDPELRPEPQLVLFASGEVTEGELEWVDVDSGELLYRVRWDLLGRTTLMPRGEEPDDEDF